MRTLTRNQTIWAANIPMTTRMNPVQLGNLGHGLSLTCKILLLANVRQKMTENSKQQTSAVCCNMDDSTTLPYLLISHSIFLVVKGGINIWPASLYIEDSKYSFLLRLWSMQEIISKTISRRTTDGKLKKQRKQSMLESIGVGSNT